MQDAFYCDKHMCITRKHNELKHQHKENTEYCVPTLMRNDISIPPKSYINAFKYQANSSEGALMNIICYGGDRDQEMKRHIHVMEL